LFGSGLTVGSGFSGLAAFLGGLCDLSGLGGLGFFAATDRAFEVLPALTDFFLDAVFIREKAHTKLAVLFTSPVHAGHWNAFGFSQIGLRMSRAGS
jgi:hypothetical protein